MFKEYWLLCDNHFYPWLVICDLLSEDYFKQNKYKQRNGSGTLHLFTEHQVRPLPPVKKRITLKTALKAFGLFCTFTGSGLLGYKLFVALPSYNGPTRDLQNKPIVITQPCSKISRELVYNLAKQGAHLILADDHWDRCDELKERLIRKYGMKSDMIECRRLELDSMISIRRFTASLLTDYSQLDTVIIQSPSCISNIISGKHCLTHDGFEKELGINYFATYLLSRLLINRLNENNGRLILVVDTKSANIDQENVMNPSEPSQITIPLDNINWDNDINYTPKNAYRRAQWFLLMFADRKGSNTSLFCTTVDSSIIDSINDQSIVHCAPIYQDLRLLISSKHIDQTIENRRYASELLWRLSEKWTRLDTHPNPLPLPNRPLIKKNDNNDSKLLDDKVETVSTIHA
uniref:WW domain-containing oxidoreductase n=1 Tax=Schistosoma haematobium TaxID=6185 RepID=A0A095AVJ3_SCHHA